MNIRLATLADTEQLRPLFDGQLQYMAELQPRQYQAVPQSEAFMQAAILEENAALLVAEEHGEIIGLVSIFLQDTGETPIRVPQVYANLDSLYVRADSRGKGVGTALFRAAWDWARERGAASIQLMMLAENDRAKAFYEKLGMRYLKHIYIME